MQNSPLLRHFIRARQVKPRHLVYPGAFSAGLVKTHYRQTGVHAMVDCAAASVARKCHRDPERKARGA